MSFIVRALREWYYLQLLTSRRWSIRAQAVRQLSDTRSEKVLRALVTVALYDESDSVSKAAARYISSGSVGSEETACKVILEACRPQSPHLLPKAKRTLEILHALAEAGRDAIGVLCTEGLPWADKQDRLPFLAEYATAAGASEYIAEIVESSLSADEQIQTLAIDVLLKLPTDESTAALAPFVARTAVFQELGKRDLSPVLNELGRNFRDMAQPSRLRTLDLLMERGHVELVARLVGSGMVSPEFCEAMLTRLPAAVLPQVCEEACQNSGRLKTLLGALWVKGEAAVPFICRQVARPTFPSLRPELIHCLARLVCFTKPSEMACREILLVVDPLLANRDVETVLLAVQIAEACGAPQLHEDEESQQEHLERLSRALQETLLLRDEKERTRLLLTFQYDTRLTRSIWEAIASVAVSAISYVILEQRDRWGGGREYARTKEGSEAVRFLCGYVNSFTTCVLMLVAAKADTRVTLDDTDWGSQEAAVSFADQRELAALELSRRRVRATGSQWFTARCIYVQYEA